MGEHAEGATPKKGIPVWAIVLIVCGVLAIPCGAGLVTVVAVVVPRMQEQAKRTHCMSNLMGLGQLYLVNEQMHPGSATQRSGSALWVGFRKDGQIKRGNEQALICAQDTIPLPETDAERRQWDTVDLDHAPRSLCSYAGRDFDAFPIDPKHKEREAVGACLNHRGGALVLFSDASVEFLTTDELGFEGDDEKRVGPDSQSMLLRTLRFGDRSYK